MADKIAKGEVGVGGLFDLAGTGLTGGVSVEQQAHHELRMIGGEAAIVLAAVVVPDGTKVEFPGQVADEAG